MMADSGKFINVDDAIGSLRDQMASCPPVQKSDSFRDALVKACVPKLLHDVIVWLMNRPVVDAVEVVRCKDCKSYNGGGCDLVYGEYEPEPNDFCSRGTKKYEIDVELMEDGE